MYYMGSGSPMVRVRVSRTLCVVHAGVLPTPGARHLHSTVNQ